MPTLFEKSSSLGSISYSGISWTVWTCIGAICYAFKKLLVAIESRPTFKITYPKLIKCKKECNNNKQRKKRNTSTYRRFCTILLQKLDHILVFIVYCIGNWLKWKSSHSNMVIILNATCHQVQLKMMANTVNRSILQHLPK